MHTDEAVNARIVGDVLEGGVYQYDPEDRHGPALTALTLPIARLSGVNRLHDLTQRTVRIGPVLAGALIILLFAPLARECGVPAAIVSATLLALGPLAVYYSRYFIHETFFLAATVGFMITGWRTLTTGSRVQGILAGSCAALMLACKETAVLHFAAFAPAAAWSVVRGVNGLSEKVAADGRRRMGGALFSNQSACEHRPSPLPSPTRCDGATARRVRWERVADRPGEGASTPRWTQLLLPGAFALLAFLLVTVLFYTWAGRNWRGPLDLVGSFAGFADRAGGHGHEKAFWYYTQLIGSGWAGWPVLGLAAFGVIATFRRSLVQSLFIYTIAVWLIYSMIPYKTPWLALNFWLPISMLAGCGVSSLWQGIACSPSASLRCSWRTGTQRVLAITALVLVTGLCARDTWFTSFAKPSDASNPYAYAHTSSDIERLPVRLTELDAANGAAALRIAVVAIDPWPLPWYLRQFATGFWQPGQNRAPADVYITSTEAADGLGERLQGRRPEFFEVRPGVLVILWSPIESAAGVR
jgi:uncharacterized protein (TIGR03663 family)